MAKKELYADIVLPLARGVFTFRVDGQLAGALTEGMCVKTPLGARRFYTGVVWRLHDERPPYKTIKAVDTIVPGSPVIPEHQRRLWDWIAEYYMCSLGDVMRAALPSALKPGGFSAEEFSAGTYRPPVTRHVSLGLSLTSHEALNEVFEKLRRRATKQYEALLSLISLLGEEPFGKTVPRQVWDTGYAASSALERKGYVSFTEIAAEIGKPPPLPDVLPALSHAQTAAVDSIRRQFFGKDTVLLRGVTGSGKTEIYMHLIAGQLRAGRNVLYLMPEIAMTSQLISRIEGWFGARVIRYHSAFTDAARVRAYMTAAGSSGGHIVLGTRSALFLPLENLGLVIVDEEHDPGYKQENSPRYNARDCALVLARIAGARTLLGSATPSVESYINAMEDKYGSVVLTERYAGVPMPRFIISDTLAAVKRGERTAHFNKALLERINVALDGGRQVMLFQNRRGFAPYVECGGCGWVAMCPDCNVTLTYHKSDSMLRCHYCGHAEHPTAECPSCGQHAIGTRGFGTEKVAEELQRVFPSARIARLDRDSATSPGRYGNIVSSFERGDTDILIGTQMITKGFDFGGVSLVGILNADNLLNYPDFRASERAFQMITQVAGRAGRRDVQGEVVVQTTQPDNPVIRQAAAEDYEGMAAEQLAERALFFYPPYSRLIGITLRHRDKELLWDAANNFGEVGRAHFGPLLLGPQPPVVDKVRGEYLLSFLLKCERTAPIREVRRKLSETAQTLASDKRLKGVSVIFNVDPQ